MADVIQKKSNCLWELSSSSLISTEAGQLPVNNCNNPDPSEVSILKKTVDLDKMLLVRSQHFFLSSYRTQKTYKQVLVTGRICVNVMTYVVWNQPSIASVTNRNQLIVGNQFPLVIAGCNHYMYHDQLVNSFLYLIITYEQAVHNTYIKANKKLFTLRKIRPYISQRISALIYKQFVLPILDYADFLFDSTVKRELDLLDNIQERALTLIGRGQVNNRMIENTYAIEPLKARRRKHHLSLMYRISKIKAYLDTSRPEIILRNRDKIKFVTAKTKLTKVAKSPYYRGVSLWDMLPQQVQRATTKVRFKKQIA